MGGVVRIEYKLAFALVRRIQLNRDGAGGMGVVDGIR